MIPAFACQRSTAFNYLPCQSACHDASGTTGRKPKPMFLVDEIRYELSNLNGSAVPVIWVTHTHSMGSLVVTLFSVPLVRETTTGIGFCAPFFDSHVPLRHCLIHMGHLASNFLLITLLMRSRYPERSSAGNRHTVNCCSSMILYGIVFPVESRTSIGWKNMRTAGRLVLHHNCGLDSVFHTRFVFRQCGNGIFVSSRSTCIVFAYEEVEKSAPWTRYQLNNNADDGHLGVKPRL
jgi:hypothetical protein